MITTAVRSPLNAGAGTGDGQTKLWSLSIDIKSQKFEANHQMDVNDLGLERPRVRLVVPLLAGYDRGPTPFFTGA